MRTSGDHESAFWLRDRCAVFLRRFEPESDGFLSIGDRFGAGVSMSMPEKKRSAFPAERFCVAQRMR